VPSETTTGTPRHKKRNYPRAPLSIRVRYGSASGGLKEGFTGIMGGGGISIETVHPLPVGSEIVIEFSLPGKTGHVRVEGLVVWVRSEFDPKGLAPGMGIQFKKISATDREKILDLVMRILMGKPDIEI
jgi:uncharacterized protein (TIGR02266 family)